MRNIGTPQTLIKAIKNGMWFSARANTTMPEEIERHVLDFLNQVLQVAMIEGHDEAVERIVELINTKKTRAEKEIKEAA